MNEPQVLPVLICQRCGATNPTFATRCWLCSTSEQAHRDQTHSGGEAPQLVPLQSMAASTPATVSRTEKICAVLLVLCVVLTLLIGVGIAVQDPGMLIAFAIAICPAYLATGVRALHSVTHDQRPKASRLLLTFIFSGLFTALTLVVLAVVAFIAFFVWCFSQL